MDKKITDLIYSGNHFGGPTGTNDPKKWAKSFIKEFGLGDYLEDKIIAWFSGAIKSGYNEAFDKWAEKD